MQTRKIALLFHPTDSSLYLEVNSIFRFEFMEVFVKYLLSYLLLRSIIFNLVGILSSLFTCTWNKVPASLIHTKIEASRAAKGVKVYDVDIWYSYSYESENFTSKRFAFNYSSNSFSSLHKIILRRLKNKKQIFAWVNPKDPNQAVLFSGVNLFHIVNLCLPIISGPYQFVEMKTLKNLFKKVMLR
ncbi:DUF3592 domain-containing protein [Flocculibacter collagenilyticus]|uniref:DUF3592 domain-containing protein n=1 Tax=Flocculibacter collagenilyticus TaxID=2744479 RepID=UPI0018F5D78D|nr:DUF3592 domain-containing protein [Flocculibacter collagenilyticus]